MGSETVIKTEVQVVSIHWMLSEDSSASDQGSSYCSQGCVCCSSQKECVCVCFLLISAPVPLCPGLSSSPTVCEFIHRKCRGGSRVAGLMRSDVASPASRELSMSGRSARGKQTVDKIFNTALPVHGSNTSEKGPPQKI